MHLHFPNLKILSKMRDTTKLSRQWSSSTQSAFANFLEKSPSNTKWSDSEKNLAETYLTSISQQVQAGNASDKQQDEVKRLVSAGNLAEAGKNLVLLSVNTDQQSPKKTEQPVNFPGSKSSTKHLSTDDPGEDRDSGTMYAEMRDGDGLNLDRLTFPSLDGDGYSDNQSTKGVTQRSSRKTGLLSSFRRSLTGGIRQSSRDGTNTLLQKGGSLDQPLVGDLQEDIFAYGLAGNTHKREEVGVSSERTDGSQTWEQTASQRQPASTSESPSPSGTTIAAGCAASGDAVNFSPNEDSQTENSGGLSSMQPVSEPEVLLVTVPKNSLPGRQVLVDAPDGSRLSTTVPQHVKLVVQVPPGVTEVINLTLVLWG
jgi:hypothetical protein